VAKVRIGRELMIYGERADSDLPAVLAEVDQAGYVGLEHWAPRSPEELKQMRAALNGTGLAFAGGHIELTGLEKPAELGQWIAGVNALGGSYVIASAFWSGLEAYHKAARMLNEIGQECRDAGVVFCYHNHAHEFESADGTRPIHLLICETDPALVKLCPDVYWVHVGGESPAEFIARYHERCPYFHFKDGTKTQFRELGRGEVDLPAALTAALACQPEWIIVEQDETTLAPAESLRICREYLKGLGL